MWTIDLNHYKQKVFYMNNLKNSLKPIPFVKNVMMGCDPEFFFAGRDGKVIGSEKVLKENQGGVIIDGVQAEINPSASYCRELLADNIARCFLNLRNVMAANGAHYAVKVDTLVDISQEELNSLSEGSRRFGCAPSANIYNTGPSKTSVIKADPTKYLKRSAGGHIHLGNAFGIYLADSRYANPATCCLADQRNIESAKKIENALKKMPDTVVAILDIVLGNTCVLMDRSDGNAERRANYGRAGEHRIKPYGVEYRSLSNFWLRSYQLMSFVMGLARFGVHLVAESTPDNDYVKALFDAVPREDIVKAINTNDRALALVNFKKIQEIIKVVADENTGAEFYPIRQANLKLFYHFILRIKQKGLQYWFPEDAMTHWTGGAYRRPGGWETFCINRIYPDLQQYALDLNREAKSKRTGAVLGARI